MVPALGIVLAVAVAAVAVVLGWMRSDSLQPGSDIEVPASLAGVNVLITGASSGIGYSTAVLMCRMHANLMLHGPHENRTKRAVREMLQAAGGACKARAVVAELDDFAQVHRMANETRTHFKRVDILILNAGLHYGGPTGPDRGGQFQRRRLLSHPDSHFVSKHGQDHAMAVNHFGHFALTVLLNKVLAPDARIIVVTGGGMWTSDWRRLAPSERIKWEKMRLRAHFAYYDTKLANVCFARALRKRKPMASVIIHDPGKITTGMTLARGTPVYDDRRFSQAADTKWWRWVMSSEQAGDRMLQATFVKRPIPDVVYSYWLPPALLRPVQDHRLLPQGDWTRSKLLGHFLDAQAFSFGPLYGGVGPGCGDEQFMDYFWNYSVFQTGLHEFISADREATERYRKNFLKHATPQELKGTR